MLPMNIGMGLAQGMMPLVAYNYASGDYKRMKDVARCARIAGSWKRFPFKRFLSHFASVPLPQTLDLRTSQDCLFQFSP